MTTLHSSLYGKNPSDDTNYIYRGPMPKAAGELCVRQCTYTGAIANGDVLKLAELVKGEKIIGFFNGRAGDPDAANDATVNIGTTTAATAIASASTGMQATAALKFDAGDLAKIAAAADGDELQIALAAGAMEVSTTHYFTIVSHVPQV